MSANLDMAMKETNVQKIREYQQTVMKNIKLQQFIINDLIDFC